MTSTGISPESQLAHSLLDGLRGIEIGPAAHNPFGLQTISVGLSKQLNPVDYEIFAREQLNRCGKVAEIDISADASSLPVPDNSTDFVIHSHVWEHLSDSLGALEEWVRVVRPGGCVFVIVPKRDALPSDKERPVTSIEELILRHNSPSETKPIRPATVHQTVFSPELLFQIEEWFNRTRSDVVLVRLAFQETDDKVGNGHTIVWRVNKKFSSNLSYAAGDAHACGTN
jgi:SAM-dependent methyltransferase